MPPPPPPKKNNLKCKIPIKQITLNPVRIRPALSSRLSSRHTYADLAAASLLYSDAACCASCTLISFISLVLLSFFCLTPSSRSCSVFCLKYIINKQMLHPCAILFLKHIRHQQNFFRVAIYFSGKLIRSPKCL